MSSNFVQSRIKRATGLAILRGWARSQFWRTGPKIFVNSIPKAGTHLLTAELGRIKNLQNSRLHLKLDELVDRRPNPHEETKPNLKRLHRQISTLRGGQFFTAHFPWSPMLLSSLEEHDIRSIFVMRDPRDIVVSNFHYVLNLKRHFPA